MKLGTRSLRQVNWWKKTRKPHVVDLLNRVNYMPDDPNIPTPIIEFIGVVNAYFESIGRREAKNDKEWFFLPLSKELLWARDGWIYCTDGHRVHSVKRGFEDGWYDPRTLDKVDTDEPLRTFNIPNTYQEVDVTDFVPVDMDLVRFGNNTFNRRYIVDLFSGPHGRVRVNNPAKYEGLAVSMDDTRKAMIMPMRS